MEPLWHPFIVALLASSHSLKNSLRGTSPSCDFFELLGAVRVAKLCIRDDGTVIPCRFEQQTSYHFYSCSVLLLYEGDLTTVTKEGDRRASVKLVDFAHVISRQGNIDDNFLQGVKSLRDVLINLVKEKAVEDLRHECN